MQEDFVKIISATYKLLDFFPDGDPLKNKAKEKMLTILENSTLEDIEILEHYLELGKNMGWISSLNFLIIKKEWEVVKSTKPTSPGPVSVRPKEIRAETYSKRQEKILNILENKERAQVQDIIKEMPNVTKRTIRRDLDELLKKGEVARIGEFNQVFYKKSGNFDRTEVLS